MEEQLLRDCLTLECCAHRLQNLRSRGLSWQDSSQSEPVQITSKCP